MRGAADWALMTDPQRNPNFRRRWLERLPPNEAAPDGWRADVGATSEENDDNSLITTTARVREDAERWLGRRYRLRPAVACIVAVEVGLDGSRR
jgi:hypothetical protein